jgi:hypothetical protein
MPDHLNETDAAGIYLALKALPVSAVILDSTGRIISVNDTWKEFARQNELQMPDFGIGTNYFQYCQFDGPQASRLVEDLRELLAGRIDVLTFIYPAIRRASKDGIRSSDCRSRSIGRRELRSCISISRTCFRT